MEVIYIRLKLGIVLTLVFVLILSVGFVSAADVDATGVDALSDNADPVVLAPGEATVECYGSDGISADSIYTDSDNSFSTDYVRVNYTANSDDSEVIESTNTEEVLTADGSSEGSFTELNRIIKFSREGSIIKLNQNYTYDEKYDFRLIDGILIDKSITIDGQGNTLNGNGLANIFQISGNDVVLKNINFINGKPAIRSSGQNLQITYCNFTDCTAYTNIGGAIDSNGFNTTISHSIFKNNTASWEGGAASVSNAVIEDCEFITNIGSWGAALIINGQTTVRNTIFTGNKGDNGIIFMNSNGGIVENCIFKDNTATSVGGAIYFNSGNSHILNCTFENNSANYGGALRVDEGFNFISNCTFKDNTANTDGQAIYNKGPNNVFIECNFAGQSGENTFSTINNLSLVDNIELDNKITYGEGVVLLDYIDYYVKVGCNGIGTIDDPGNWTYVYSQILPGRTIYLQSGTYLDIVNVTVDKTINIVGLDEVIFDLNNNGYAFRITAPDVLVDNIGFMNGFSTEYGGAVTYELRGSLTNSRFINNQGIVTNVQHNYQLYLENNTFVGEYLKFAPRLVSQFARASIKVSPSNYLTIVLYVDGKKFASSGDTVFDLSNLSLGSHEVSVVFEAGNGNSYINTKNASFILQNDVIIYLSPAGNGNKDGTTVDDALPFYSLSDYLVDGCQVILLNGLYKDGYSYIDKDYVSITGNGNSILDNTRLTIGGSSISVSNLTFQNLLLDSGNGVISWYGYNGTLFNSNFINCTAPLGAAIKWEGNDGIIDQCNFLNSSSTNQFGVVNFASFNGYIKNSNFTNCYSPNGGAMGVSGSNNIIDNCVFNACTSNNGGAIRLNARDNIISNSKFIQCNGSGAAILSSLYQNIVNCSFNQCVGMRTVALGSGSIENSNFTNNSDPSWGRLLQGDNLEIINCNFNSNGYILGHNVTIIDSNFTNYTSRAIGTNGRDQQNYTIIGCHFESVSVCIRATNANIEDCSFKNITTECINVNGNSSVKNCNFTNTRFDINCEVDTLNMNVTGCIFNSSKIRYSKGNVKVYCNYVIKLNYHDGFNSNNFYDNWFGKNDITAAQVKTITGFDTSHVNVDWKSVYSNLVVGEWNAVIQTYFKSNETGTEYSYILDVPVDVTVTTNNAQIKDASTGQNIKILPGNGEIKVTGTINGNVLTELAFNVADAPSFTDLQNLINGYTDGETLILHNNYTYNANTDSSLVGGLNVGEGVTVDFNNAVVDGAGQAKIFNITNDNVGLVNVVIKNSHDPISWNGDNAIISNFTVGEGISGTVINVNGNDAEIDGVDLSNLNSPNDVGIKIEGNSTIINGITANGSQGTLLDLTGDNATIQSVDLNNHNGDAIKTNGDGTVIGDVSAVGGSGSVITATGTNANVTGIDLTDYNGNGLVIDGYGASINDVSATGGESNVISVIGDNIQVAGLNLTNHGGSGISITGNDSVVSNLVVTGGNSTLVTVEGEGLQVSEVNITDHNGLGISTTGLAIVNDINVDGGSGNVINSTSGTIQVNNLVSNDYDGTLVAVDGADVYVENVQVNGGSGSVVVGNGNDILVSGVDMANHENGGIEVDVTGNAEINNITATNTSGIAINVNAGNANINEITLENITGTGVKTNGSSNISDVTVTGGNGTVVDVNGDNTTVSGLQVTDHSGDVVNAEGNNTKISNVTATNNTEGTVIKTNGSSNISDVTVTGGNGTVVDVNGDGTFVDNVNITEYFGTGVNVTGSNTTVDQVYVYGGNVTNDVPEDAKGSGVDYPTTIEISSDYIRVDDKVTVTINNGAPEAILTVTINGITTVVENNTVVIDLPTAVSGTYDVTVECNGKIDTKTVTVYDWSFNDLKAEIEKQLSEGNNNITLEHNYVFQEGDSVISVPENFTIDGNGHVIDAQNKSSIFIVEGDNVTISNITLTGGNGVNGGAIYWSGNDGSISDVILVDNTAENGAGIYATGDNLNITSVDFVNNTATNSGAGIFSSGDNTSISNSVFEGNNATTGAGAVLDGDGATVEGTNFTGNTAVNGAGIASSGGNLNVTDSTFANNTATESGAGIMSNGTGASISDSTFEGNNATTGAGAVLDGANATVEGTNFTGNTAESGAGIVANGEGTSVTNSSFEGNNATDGSNNIASDPDVHVDVDEATKEHSEGPIDLITSRMNVRSVNIEYGNNGIIVAVVYAGNGFAPDSTVSVVIGGKTYTANVIGGIAIINLDGLDGGVYNDVAVTYNGTENYTKSTALVNFTVAPQPTNITAAAASFVVNYDGAYKVSVDTKVAGANVTFVLDGKDVGYAVSDANGVATITLTASQLKTAGVGTKLLNASFAGNENYTGSVASANITIKKEASKFAAVKPVKASYKASASSMQLTATLKDSKNKALAGKYVVFKINKKSFKVKTNAKGVATLSLNKAKIKSAKLNKKGNYKFTVTFAAEAYYNQATGKGTLKVVK